VTTLRGYLSVLASGMRASPWRMCAATALVFSSYLTQPLAALVFADVTRAVTRHDVHGATVAGAFLPLIALLNATGTRIAHVLWVELSNLNLLRFEQEIGELAQGSRGIEHHERRDHADKLELLRNEGNPLHLGIEYAVYALSAAARLVLTVVLLARVQPSLLVLLAFGLPTLVLGRRVGTVIFRARERTAAEWRRSGHIIDLALRADASAEIRIFGLEEELARRQHASRLAIRREMDRARTRALALTLLGHVVFASAYVVALLLVVHGAVRGRHSLADVVLVVTLTAQVSAVVGQSAGMSRFVQRSAQAYNRLAWLRSLIGRLYPPRDEPAAAPSRLRDGISFRHVDFAYPGTDTLALRDVDLDLPAGTTVALVGENGAGKSTLVKLLCGLYDPTNGRIEVDGVDLARIPPAAWRAQIAAGFQDFLRLEFPLRQSVGLGDLEHCDDEVAVRAALVRADAEELATQLRHGLDTPLGRSLEEGAELSGGQWQKVALARAMMRRRPLLLVLDEPTSALDAHAEHALFERYASSAREVARSTGGIAVFVSHRFSTVRMADRIVVVDGGRIVEQGTHEELLEAEGVYAELFRLQAAAFA
jgi:ATP-binding cassette subfamily B protein